MTIKPWETRHSFSYEYITYSELMRTIMNSNLDIRIEEEYDWETTASATLVGDPDHIKYLVTEAYPGL